ncbi:MAG TPA: YidB family protein [Casimicrobiaceae bacterium]|nr:YidB family protein [Casimicrobiaceae bacterium]
MFESLLSGVVNELQARNPMVRVALQVLEQNGGLQGLLQRAQAAGYEQHVQSWIGTGQNMPIDAAALTRILGSGPLARIAAQCGVNPQEVAGSLAQTLPTVVDRTTPQGSIPDDHDSLVSQAIALLTNRPV